MHDSRGEEILRMISIDGPSGQQAIMEHHSELNYSQQEIGARVSTTKPPDVIPRTAAARANTSPPSSHGKLVTTFSTLGCVSAGYGAELTSFVISLS